MIFKNKKFRIRKLISISFALMLTASSLSHGEGLVCKNLFSKDISRAADVEQILQTSPRDSAAAYLRRQLSEKFKENLMEIDKKIDILRTKNGVWETDGEMERRWTEDCFGVLVSTNQQEMIMKKFTNLFETVEFSVIRIKQSEDLLVLYKDQIAKDQIDQKSGRKIIEQINEDKQTALNALIENYRIYEKLAKILSHSIEDNSKPDQQVSALKASRTLGNYMSFPSTIDFIEKTKQIFGEQYEIKRPSFNDISETYSHYARTPEMELARKKAVLAAEKKLRLRLMFGGPQIFESIALALDKIPDKLKPLVRPFSALLGLGVDANLRRRHSSAILSVLRIPPEDGGKTKNIDLRIQALRHANALYGGDEMMITFARVVNSTDAWRAMVNRVKELAYKNPEDAPGARVVKNSIDDLFYKRMIAAEIQANKKGDLNLYEDVSPNYTAGLWMSGGIGAVAYYVYYHVDLANLFHEVSELLKNFVVF